MKKAMAFVLGLFASTGVDASDLQYEASMNFDLESVEPFLYDLSNRFGLDLDVEKLYEFAAAVPVEDERAITVNISGSGRESVMGFRVFMDDTDAPDLYLFFESQELADAVGDFMLEWAEARGM